MPTPYPQKQTLVISLVCIVAVAAVAIYAHGQAFTGQETGDRSMSVSAQNNHTQPYSGLISTSTDWKKNFFGNVATGSSFSTTKSGVSTSPEEKLTATDRLSRDVFTQVMNLNQTGLINNNAVVSNTVSGLLAKNYSSSDEPRTYAMTDILINPDNSISALKAYGNGVGSVLETYGPKQDNATLALAGIQGKDPAYGKELQANADDYHAILTRLLAIPAPQSVSAYHLGIVNGASYMMYIASALSVAGTDAMRSMEALGMYQTAFSDGLQNLLMIRHALATAGIIYGTGEGGIFFTTKNFTGLNP